METKVNKTKRLTESAMLLAVAIVLEVISKLFIPELPFDGLFRLAVRGIAAVGGRVDGLLLHVFVQSDGSKSDHLRLSASYSASSMTGAWNR